jgi:hypothetical protein
MRSIFNKLRAPRGVRLVHRGVRIVGLLAVTTAALGGIGGGTYAALASRPAAPATAAQAAARTAPGPKHLIRGFELRGAKSVPVFTLANGDHVKVLEARNARCLVRTRHGRLSGEACASSAGVHGGSAILVSDECGSSGENRMAITGLAPEGATSVRLKESDGASHLTSVVEGAFRFQGTNPGADDPYPIEVQWLHEGTATGSSALPVNGDEFCLPAE